MQHIEDGPSTLTEEVWQEVVQQRSAVAAASSHSESRITRFFNALAASMALQQRKPWSPCRDNRIMSSAEMLAQNYPQFYIQVMCG
jgi:hypothetical protein